MTSPKKERIVHSVIRDDKGTRTGYHIKDTSADNRVIAIVEYAEDSATPFVTLFKDDIGSIKKDSIKSFSTMFGLKSAIMAELTGESVTEAHDDLKAQFAKARAKLTESSNAPQSSRNRRSA